MATKDWQDVGFVIPALNEERAIGGVVSGLRSRGIKQVVVCDNGSTDRTAQVARDAGATVVQETERGYGAACLRAIEALEPATEVIGFVDGDGSDDLDDLPKLLNPILDESADFVIASRARGQAEAGALTPPQRLGNLIASSWLRYRFGQETSDLGPFRAIRKTAYQKLKMRDRNYGWTVEMQIKAARHHLRYQEFPTNYARRIGTSKVSGTVRGTLGAGFKIIGLLWLYDLGPYRNSK